MTHQCCDEVGLRREVAGSADAALRWNDGNGVLIEQELQSFDDQRPDAGMAPPEPEKLEDDHQARDMPRQWVAKPGTVIGPPDVSRAVKPVRSFSSSLVLGTD